MKTPGIAAAIAVSVPLAVLFILLFVYASHLALESLDSTFDTLIASQIAACQKRACLGLDFYARLWSLEGAAVLGPAVIGVMPPAVAAALLRTNSWITGIAMGGCIAAFMLVRGMWMLFAPPRMPGWVFIPMFGIFVVLTFRLIGWVVARRQMTPNKSLERTREE